MVVIHCAGNDIGQTSISLIVNYLKYINHEVFTEHSRINFRYVINHFKLEKAREGINSPIGDFFKLKLEVLI
jgi:hypothetical protein